MTHLNNYRPCKKCGKLCYSKIDICLNCQNNWNKEHKHHSSRLSTINHTKRAQEKKGCRCVKCGRIMSKYARRRLCWEHYTEYQQEKRLKRIREYEAMKNGLYERTGYRLTQRATRIRRT